MNKVIEMLIYKYIKVNNELEEQKEILRRINKEKEEALQVTKEKEEFKNQLEKCFKKLDVNTNEQVKKYTENITYKKFIDIANR